MKYPIGIQSFSQIIEDGYVYVDKTDLVYKLATEGKIYFLSRPRRFGKSLLVSTLKAYFEGKHDLFKGLKIDALEEKWLEYPVFHLDLNACNFVNADELRIVLEAFISTAEDKYGKSPNETSLGRRFAYVLKQAHEQTGRRAVVLIDEYDKPLLDVMETGYTITTSDGNTMLIEEYNRQLLKGFYSVFKLADVDLQFVLLTGVTKFSQVSVFSGFNQPKDLGRDPRYDALCGITNNELVTYFDEPIRQLAESSGVGYDEMLSILKRRYDGYHFSEKMVDVYNPFSIINCFDSQKISDYWFASGTPTYLMRLMANNDVNINELISREYAEPEFLDFKADKQMPLPMLYQSGYLTIKGYKERRKKYKLDFPNEEVRSGMVTLLSANYFEETPLRKAWIDNVCDALDEGDLDTFGKEITALFAGISYRFREKNEMEYERHFQYSFYLIMLMIGQYNTLAEKETSEGRIDCVMECPDYIYIFEFKRDGSADKALQQIDERGYAKPYVADSRPLYKVGVNFSTATGTIEEMKYELIER